jgi:hypothetical protein
MSDYIENKAIAINKTKIDGFAIQTVGKTIYRLVHDESLSHHTALTTLENKDSKFSIKHIDGETFGRSDLEIDEKLEQIINTEGEVSFEGFLVCFTDLDNEGSFRKSVCYKEKVNKDQLEGVELIALAKDEYSAVALEAIFKGYLWTISRWDGPKVENINGVVISPMEGGKPHWGESLDLKKLFDHTKRYVSPRFR